MHRSFARWLAFDTAMALVLAAGLARGQTPVPTYSPGTGRPDLGVLADLQGKAVFPPDNPWNQRVDTAQVDPRSDAILANLGWDTSLHPDFGANWNGGPYGIPYVIVPDNTMPAKVKFDYARESDAGPYPIPLDPPIEKASDAHLILITQHGWKLFELFALRAQPDGWHAGSGAIFDLATGTTRPAGWTSADAAGLPIFPGLVRYDEVYGRHRIDHALRFTVEHTRKAYVAPARHSASPNPRADYPPMGMRIRLKASFDISRYPAPDQVILRALKKYGMILADNGGNMFLSGTADARWNDDDDNLLKQVHVSDFEVVQMTGIVTR